MLNKKDIPCEKCNSHQIMNAQSNIPGIDYPDMLQCGCCESLFKIDDNDRVTFFHIGRKQ